MDIKRTTNSILYDEGVDRVLMVCKRRNSHGFGAKGALFKDKYLFPGGKVEPNETFLEGAIRETKEETGLTPLSLTMKGIIDFQHPEFLMKDAIFFSKLWEGELLNETEEATVEWIKRTEIPFDKMFPSDIIWVPFAFKTHFFMSSVSNKMVDGKLKQNVDVIKPITQIKALELFKQKER